MVEKVSMSHKATSGHVERLGTVGRRNSRGEFVPQRERAQILCDFFIAEGCPRVLYSYMFNITERSEQRLHGMSGERCSGNKWGLPVRFSCCTMLSPSALLLSLSHNLISCSPV